MALGPAPPNHIDGDDDRQQKGAATHDTPDYGGPSFPLVTIGHSVGGIRCKHPHIGRGCAAEPIVWDAFDGVGARQTGRYRD